MQRRLIWLFVVTVAVGGCEQLSPEMQLIHDAAEALGGVEAVEQVATLRIEGSGNNFRLGQNRTPDAALPMAAVESYVVAADLRNHRMRWEIASANFAGRVNAAVTAMDGSVAFDVGQDGARRAGSPAARERHAEYYHHPLTVLQVALAETGEAMAPTVGNLRQEAGNDVVDISTPDGSELALHVDPASRHVVRIESTGYNSNLGDIEIATAFRDYAAAGGLMLPGAITRTVDRQPVTFLRVSHTVDADVGDLAAPADVASAPEPDPPAANVTDEELADGVWLLAGQSHHSVLVELPESAVLVEAPQHDTRTLAAIARARELVPDKPLSHVVNTHHHFDHSGGIRAAVAEGLTVITHETNRELFEELAARPHTVAADHLARQPAELMLETVAGDDTLELGEGRRTMQIFRMGDNPHADGALVVHLPTERMLVQADMFIPGVGGEFAETAAALLAAIEDRNLRVDRLVPIHGAVMALSDLEEAVEAGD